MYLTLLYQGDFNDFHAIIKAMIGAINIALTGLGAATKQLNASASNIANLQTVGSIEDGGQAPYTPLRTQNTSINDDNGNGQGVAGTYVAKNPAFVPAYDPDSPFANADGIIGVPNVDLAEEAVNINIAEIQYKANLKTIQAASDLSKELFRALDKKA